MKNQYHHVKLKCSMTAKKLSKFHSRLRKNIDNGSFAKLSRAKQHKLTSRVDKLKERYNSYLHILHKGVATGAIAAAFLITLPSYAQIDLEQQFGTDNPLDTAGLVNQIKPQLVDIDGDSDLDLFVGLSDGTVSYFKNTGTISSPIFERQLGANNPLSSVDTIGYINLSFADIDNDGDYDALITSSRVDFAPFYIYSPIHEYRNNGDANNPVFNLINGDSALLNDIEFHGHCQGTFADADGDGDYDVVIAEGFGSIYYYPNLGTIDSIGLSYSNPDNPFSPIPTLDEPKLTFIDFDNDNDLDVFVTPHADSTLLFENITNGPGAPEYVYNAIDNQLKNITTGDNPAPTFGDLNNDGVLDLVIGNSDGDLLYFESQPVTSGFVSVKSFEMALFPNPVANSAMITSEKMIESLSIHSTTGALMLSLRPNTNAVDLNLGKFNQGTYIISLTATDGSTSSQVITKD